MRRVTGVAENLSGSDACSGSVWDGAVERQVSCGYSREEGPTGMAACSSAFIALLCYCYRETCSPSNVVAENPADGRSVRSSSHGPPLSRQRKRLQTPCSKAVTSQSCERCSQTPFASLQARRTPFEAHGSGKYSVTRYGARLTHVSTGTAASTPMFWQHAHSALHGLCASTRLCLDVSSREWPSSGRRVVVGWSSLRRWFVKGS